MDLQTVELLACYNARTNNEMNKIIENLSKEQWDKKFGGFFESIHLLCNHIYLADFNWLKRYSNLREFRYIEHETFKKDLGFDSLAITSINDYLEKRKELDEFIFEFTKELKEEDLKSILVYKDSEGEIFRRNFGGLVLHLFNHAVHHRGMISIYLEELGISNDYSSIVKML